MYSQMHHLNPFQQTFPILTKAYFSEFQTRSSSFPRLFPNCSKSGKRVKGLMEPVTKPNSNWQLATVTMNPSTSNLFFFFHYLSKSRGIQISFTSKRAVCESCVCPLCCCVSCHSLSLAFPLVVSRSHTEALPIFNSSLAQDVSAMSMERMLILDIMQKLKNILGSHLFVNLTVSPATRLTTRHCNDTFLWSKTNILV